MEYEIGDDPQGLPDVTEGDRDGGLRDGRVIFRKVAPNEPSDEDSAIRQLGEAA